MTTSYVEIGCKEFFDLLSMYFYGQGLDHIKAAYAFAKGGHKGESRDDGFRYFEHCKSVAWILMSELGLLTSWELLVSALLHDLIEDTWLMTLDRIEINFGRRVRVGIDAVSKRPGESHEHYLDRLLSPETPWESIMVKLADRLQNLRSLSGTTPEKRQRKLEETRDLYLPHLEQFYENLPERLRTFGRKLGEMISEITLSELAQLT
jgi:(p)ppGpp synthase/HD superfamily hydrolase